jgi:hypothetical protein
MPMVADPIFRGKPANVEMVSEQMRQEHPLQWFSSAVLTTIGLFSMIGARRREE